MWKDRLLQEKKNRSHRCFRYPSCAPRTGLYRGWSDLISMSFNRKAVPTISRLVGVGLHLFSFFHSIPFKVEKRIQCWMWVYLNKFKIIHSWWGEWRQRTMDRRKICISFCFPRVHTMECLCLWYLLRSFSFACFFLDPTTSRFCNVLGLYALSSFLSPLLGLVFLGLKNLSGNNTQVYISISDLFPQC